MNIPPLSYNTSSGATTPPVATDVRQARAQQGSGSTPAQPPQTVVPTEKTEASRQQVEDAVKSVNEFLKPINDSIQFSIDDDTGISIIKVIDIATKDVIRQFPSEEMLSIAKAIDQMKGLLVQQKV